MRIDFSDIPVKDKAFSELPMTFADSMTRNFLSAIVDIAAIETGNRTAREYWQQKQLQNLLEHAANRSAFWKKRIGTRRAKSVRLADLPIQTRADVVKQYESEGSLLQSSDQNRVYRHSTSGSTGKPVQFFITTHNSKFNTARSAAQFFMEGRDLSLNWTRLDSQRISGELGFETRKTASWIEPLQNLVRTGSKKHITYFHPSMEALCRELEHDRVGYLVAQPRFIDVMLQHVSPEYFRQIGTAMFIPLAEAMDPKLRKTFSSVNIPVQGSYSSEEIGPIASECERVPGMFHVATSNVIVEIDHDLLVTLERKRLSRILVTHLHSYATPFIRYDLGDAATLEPCCPCGHDGPALSNIYGRSKSLVKHPDGRVSIFLMGSDELTAIARFNEYRVRQIDLQTIIVDIGGRDSLATEEAEALTALIRSHAGNEFDIQINPVAEIDWGYSTKRLGFINEVL